jgi:ATP-dependent helicase/nuclease subunit A
MGLGMAAVDHGHRLRYPTIAKSAIAAKMAAESLSEELRVLYVAMTRARDIMIMTYASDALEKELQQMVLRLDMGGKDLLVREAVCPGEWILLSALHRTEAGELFQLGGKPENTAPGEPAWQIRVVQAPAHGQDAALEEMPIRKSLPDEELLRRILGDRYSHAAATSAPSKLTATQQKGRVKDEEAAADTPAKLERTKPWRQASFGKQTVDGRTYGNAIHSAMQYLDFSVCGDLEGIRREIHRLEQQRFLSADQAKMIQPELIHNFLCTPLGQKVSKCEQLIREFKFSILIDGAEYDPACADEKILLQGVVDCALVEEDGIILIDFKTDYVTEETVDTVSSSYRQQVQTYADALHRIYEKNVKEAYLYFFRLNRFVRV